MSIWESFFGKKVDTSAEIEKQKEKKQMEMAREYVKLKGMYGSWDKEEKKLALELKNASSQTEKARLSRKLEGVRENMFVYGRQINDFSNKLKPGILKKYLAEMKKENNIQTDGVSKEKSVNHLTASERVAYDARQRKMAEEYLKLKGFYEQWSTDSLTLSRNMMREDDPAKQRELQTQLDLIKENMTVYGPQMADLLNKLAPESIKQAQEQVALINNDRQPMRSVSEGTYGSITSTALGGIEAGQIVGKKTRSGRVSSAKIGIDSKRSFDNKVSVSGELVSVDKKLVAEGKKRAETVEIRLQDIKKKIAELVPEIQEALVSNPKTVFEVNAALTGLKHELSKILAGSGIEMPSESLKTRRGGKYSNEFQKTQRTVISDRKLTADRTAEIRDYKSGGRYDTPLIDDAEIPDALRKRPGTRKKEQASKGIDFQI